MSRVENEYPDTVTSVMFNPVIDGGIRFDMMDDSTGSNWIFQNQFGSFDVTLAGTGVRNSGFISMAI